MLYLLQAGNLAVMHNYQDKEFLKLQHKVCHQNSTLDRQFQLHTFNSKLPVNYIM